MRFLPFILLLLATSHLFAQKNELSILNNRFYITFPDSAKNIARSTDIMGPGPNENNETRIVYDEGKKRLVFFARELNVKTITDLTGALKKEATVDNPFTVKEIYSNSAVKVLLQIPDKFDDSKNAILLGGLIIQNADSTLCKFDAYINPAAFAEKAKFTQLAMAAFSTFRPGNRQINYTAHTDTFNIMGTKAKLQIKLPQNYIAKINHGTDFEVYNIIKLPSYGSDENASMLIYFGFYPSALAREYEVEDFKTPDTNGDFMFHSLLWNNYYDKKQKLVLREQIFDDDEIEAGMKVHVGLISNDSKGIEELSRLVKDLLIVYDPSHAKQDKK